MQLHLCGIEATATRRVVTGGGTAARARRPGPLLVTRHAGGRTFAALRAAGAAAGAAAAHPALAQQLVLLRLLGIEVGAAAGAEEAASGPRREAVQAAGPALSLPVGSKWEQFRENVMPFENFPTSRF